ncbi:hypothetical protein cypCar_00038873, partial [Cyprinus carpio]
EDEEDEEDEDEGDSFDPSSPLAEHSNNNSYRSRRRSALPVRRLWHYLVKQEEVQDTFIRNIFTKKQDQNEIEAGLGFPGGRARIIHKESDIITAFAINKVL